MTDLAVAATCHQALGHPARLRVLAVLRDGPLCVGELQGLSGLAFSTISRHVAELERAGLVEQVKEGRWVWCRLSQGEAARRTLECVWQQLAADPTLEADRCCAKQLRAGRPGLTCAGGTTTHERARLAPAARPISRETG